MASIGANKEVGFAIAVVVAEKVLSAVAFTFSFIVSMLKPGQLLKCLYEELKFSERAKTCELSRTERDVMIRKQVGGNAKC